MEKLTLEQQRESFVRYIQFLSGHFDVNVEFASSNAMKVGFHDKGKSLKLPSLENINEQELDVLYGLALRHVGGVLKSRKNLRSMLNFESHEILNLALRIEQGRGEKALIRKYAGAKAILKKHWIEDVKNPDMRPLILGFNDAQATASDWLGLMCLAQVSQVHSGKAWGQRLEGDHLEAWNQAQMFMQDPVIEKALKSIPLKWEDSVDMAQQIYNQIKSKISVRPLQKNEQALEKIESLQKKLESIKQSEEEHKKNMAHLRESIKDLKNQKQALLENEQWQTIQQQLQTSAAMMQHQLDEWEKLQQKLEALEDRQKTEGKIEKRILQADKKEQRLEKEAERWNHKKLQGDQKVMDSAQKILQQEDKMKQWLESAGAKEQWKESQKSKWENLTQQKEKLEEKHNEVREQKNQWDQEWKEWDQTHQNKKNELMQQWKSLRSEYEKNHPQMSWEEFKQKVLNQSQVPDQAPLNQEQGAEGPKEKNELQARDPESENPSSSAKDSQENDSRQMQAPNQTPLDQEQGAEGSKEKNELQARDPESENPSSSAKDSQENDATQQGREHQGGDASMNTNAMNQEEKLMQELEQKMQMIENAMSALQANINQKNQEQSSFQNQWNKWNQQQQELEKKQKEEMNKHFESFMKDMQQAQKQADKNNMDLNLIPQAEKMEGWDQANQMQEEWDQKLQNEEKKMILAGRGIGNKDLLTALDQSLDDLLDVDPHEIFKDVEGTDPLNSFNDKKDKQSQALKVKENKKKHTVWSTAYDQIKPIENKNIKTVHEFEKKWNPWKKAMIEVFRKHFKTAFKTKFLGGQEEGSFDVRNIYKLALNQGDDIYEKIIKKPDIKVHASIVVDISGSLLETAKKQAHEMKETDPVASVQKVLWGLSEALKAVHVEHEILAVCAPREEKLAQMKISDAFNRKTCRLQTWVVKDFNEKDLKGLHGLEIQSADNSDGESLRIAQKRLSKKAGRKILIFISDGKPYMHDADSGILDHDLLESVKECQKYKIDFMPMQWGDQPHPVWNDECIKIENIESLPKSIENFWLDKPEMVNQKTVQKKKPGL